MIKSQSAKHREADQSDKHLVVNGVENLMVDGRGKVRPFGLTKPKAAPTLEVDESGGELRRDAGYSYVYAPYDSYHNVEGEPSPATEFIKPGSDSDYRTVSVGELDPDTGDFHLNVIKVSGTNLSKTDNFYVGQCIAVLIENDDRPTPYSQWQYRKITEYKWDGADEVGIFTVARDFVNVDTDPEDQNYEVRLSDMDMEEGEVGGKSAGNRKLVLDPNASTDVSSYRLKVIRIVQGVGKGQSRFIMDASINSMGLVEITVSKPWKKKPKFVDPTRPKTQEKQDSLKTRKDAKPGFFNKNWSSSYVIFDPLRFNGLCFDGEVEARDKKTGRITISGLGTQQSILSGSVIRFMQGTNGSSKIVVSLENANTDADWADDGSLINKRLKITSGPGAGKDYVITAAEASGSNSIKLTLGIPKDKSDDKDVSISGTPTAKSTYVIYTADSTNDSDLTIVSSTVEDDDPEVMETEDWNKQGMFEGNNLSLSRDAYGTTTVTVLGNMGASVEMWPGKMIELVGLKDMGNSCAIQWDKKDGFGSNLSLSVGLEKIEGKQKLKYVTTITAKGDLGNVSEDQWAGKTIQLTSVNGNSTNGYEKGESVNATIWTASMTPDTDADGNTYNTYTIRLEVGYVPKWIKTSNPNNTKLWEITVMGISGGARLYLPGDSFFANVVAATKSDTETEGVYSYSIIITDAPPWVDKPQKYPYYVTTMLWQVSIYQSASGSGTYAEIYDEESKIYDNTRIYISSKADTGIWEEEEETTGAVGNTQNKIVVDGLYTVSIPVKTPANSKIGNFSARITRFIHEVGTDADGRDYITVIGLMPRMYKKPNKENDSATDNAPTVLEPEDGGILQIHGSNSRDGYYTGWRALFINTTEMGGNKQRLKVKEARVIASWDATGEIIVDKEIAGVKPGWQCVLYSEYTSALGTCVNSAEKSVFYKKGKADYGLYDDFLPLEPFASSEDKFYNGWTLEVLTKGKTKKDGSTKYTKTPTKYRNKQRRTVVAYYGKSRRAYVYRPYDNENAWRETEGEPFNPKLKGNEFIWLYDPSTSIEKMFSEESEESVANEYGIKIKVKGIKRCSLDGVDKIRLYRASEATGAYHLVCDLENKDQDYLDNTPEEHLSVEIDLGHTPPPPCSKVCEYKGRFILGGAIKNNPTAYLTRGGHMSAYLPDYGDADHAPNPIIEKYLYTDGKDFTGRAMKVSPAIGILCDEHVGTVVPQTDETNTEELKVGLAISAPEADGVIAWCEKRQFSGVFQRSRVSVVGKQYNTDWVFLSPSCSGNLEEYRRSVLCFSDLNGNEQRWPFYASHADIRYTPENKQFIWQQGKKVLLPLLNGTVYPTPFTIRTSVWVIYRQDGKYYSIDAKSKTPKELEVREEYGLLFITAKVNQGESFNNFTYHIGGNAKQAVTAEIFPEEDVPSGTSGDTDGKNYIPTPTAPFRLFAVHFGLDNEDLVSCYVGADAEVLTYQEPNTYKPILTIPECIENSHSASTYSDSGAAPVDPPVKTAYFYNGQLVWISVWDKEYTGKQPDGAVSLVARDNAKTVYVTAATDGDVEKTDLASSFVLNDSYGTDVTAITTWLDKAYVFKQRGIYAFDPDVPALHIVSNDIGCIATDSMVRGRSGLYWMAESRRIMRSDFEHGMVYVGEPVQPWLDGYVDFDGWKVDKDHLTDLLATYDVQKDEYVMFIPAVKGQQSRLICLCFCDQHQMWYRVEDDNLHSDNKSDCAFRFDGGAAYAGAKGIWVYRDQRSGYAAWLWKSIQRDEGNFGVMKHVKRIQILNVINEDVPSQTTGEPTATFNFFKDMRKQPEGDYQHYDRHTGRTFYTNRVAQLIHVGVRALLWQFKFFGSGFVRIFGFDVQYRTKGDAETDWGDTPN